MIKITRIQFKRVSKLKTWSLFYPINYVIFNTLAALKYKYCSDWPRLKLNIKIGLHTTTQHPPHKLLGSNISAVTGPIWIKL